MAHLPLWLIIFITIIITYRRISSSFFLPKTSVELVDKDNDE